MATWKKIISSGSNADLLNVTASSGINIGTLTEGDSLSTTYVLVRDNATGEIKYRTQTSIGGLGSSVNVFSTASAGGTPVIAETSTDTLNFAAGNNVGISGNDGTSTITFSAVTKSVADITTILSASLAGGNHENITINEYTSGVFSLTGSSQLEVLDTTGQTGVDLTFNSTNSSLTASLVGLTTESSVMFADITATGNISASGYISASAINIKNDATIGGNLTLDGNFLFDGYNFETSNILNHSGSNIFGTELTDTHQFTGSISITGSGVTLVDGIFTGDGSGLTNLPASALPDDLLSSSLQIANEISGAYTADGVTINKTGGVFSAITSTGVATGNAGLATGGDIFTYVNNATSSLATIVANNYITSITDAGGITVTNPNAGATTLKININGLGGPVTPAVGDFIAFSDSDNVTKKATIAALGAIITGSSAGTVTTITEGNGIDVSGDASVNPTIAVDPGNNIQVDSDGVALSQTVSGVTNLTATTGSFGKLTVTGDTTILNTETVSTQDNFILLNSNLNQSSGNPSEDAGISVNRGSSPNANLFWTEDVGSQTNIGRWSLSLDDGAYNGVSSTADAYLTSVSSSNNSPADGVAVGGTQGYGNMHIDLDDGEIWIYV